MRISAPDRAEPIHEHDWHNPSAARGVELDTWLQTGLPSHASAQLQPDEAAKGTVPPGMLEVPIPPDDSW